MMPKGTVLEAGEDWAILLLPGGEFKKVKTKQRLHIGQMHSPKTKTAYQPLAAAAVLIMALVFSVNFFTVTAYAHFSQGVELGVNGWGRVISIRASGVQGEFLTRGMQIWGKSVEEVLPVLLERAMERSDKQEESIFIKVEAQGKYWTRGQSGLEHINRTLDNYSKDNSKGRILTKEDLHSWIWQKDSDTEVPEAQSESKRLKVDDEQQKSNKESGNKAHTESDEPQKSSNTGNSDNARQKNNPNNDNNNSNNRDNSNNGDNKGDSNNKDSKAGNSASGSSKNNPKKGMDS